MEVVGELGPAGAGPVDFGVECIAVMELITAMMRESNCVISERVATMMCDLSMLIFE